MNLTYRQLLKALLDIPVERLDDTATIFDDSVDEFYPVTGTIVTDASCDVLDPGHFVIEVNHQTDIGDYPR